MENRLNITNPPLYEKMVEKPKLYRSYACLHLALLVSFLGYRLLNPLDESYGVWILAFACELWFAFQWILECNLRWLLVDYKTYPERLAYRYSGESTLKLPPLDIIITTTDPFREPAITTANTVLSVLAIDYPVQKFACYVSDDGASPITFYSLVQTLSFAKRWVPFCRKFGIEIRAPSVYFSKESPQHSNSFDTNFVQEWQLMKDEYEDLKRRITEALEMQEVPLDWICLDGFAHGSSDVRNHSSVVKVIYENQGDKDDILPHLVYVAREKRLKINHHYKAGAMNVMARVSGVMTNAPFIVNLDCDMFVSNSKAIQHAMCFFLDCKSERECGFVQFPQLFHGGIKDDPFGNQLRIYLSTMYKGMNGLQGPPYGGTGCFHRRKALYGVPMEKKTSTAAFGYTGPDIFLYSFPLILLAVLGAIYLQARGYQDLNLARKKARVKLSRRLIFNRGPLGFVSAAELLTLVIFVGLMGWTLYSYVSNDFRKIAPKVLKPGNHHIWQYKLEKFGTRLGYIGNLCLAVLFLPVTRGLDLLHLIGVHFEISVKYHIWLGNTMMVIYTLHGLCFSIVWGSRNSLLKELTRWDKTGRANLPGVIALLSGMIMWLTSIKPIRRKFFELFYYTHHIYVIFIVFFALHTNDRHFCTVLSGIFVFFIDRFLRFLQSGRTAKILCARILPCKAVELTFSRHPGLKYISTSVILLKIPAISRLQWHPFSITSSSSADKDRISVLIKCQGEWTERLYNFIYASHLSKIRAVSLSAAVEGPYGPDSNYFLRYDSLLLIAGGSGVTPFLSILQEIMSRDLKYSSPRILLIVVVKKREDLSMLNLISPTLLHQSGLQSEGFLKVEAFVTQEEAPDYDSQTPSYEFKAVHFETKDISCTIPALLGTESKLWRASLIFTTFVVFLILLGLLNSLVVYPKDHNSYNIYPSWARRLFVVLALAMGVAIAVSVMAIWKWKSCMKLSEHGHDHHSGVKVDEGREELPIWDEHGYTDSLSVLDLDNVYYGRRPDFQGIFSTCAKEEFGSNVGVLVCGPQGMQENVASLCRQHCSLTGNNLTIAFNFHSISFCL